MKCSTVSSFPKCSPQQKATKATPINRRSLPKAPTHSPTCFGQSQSNRNPQTMPAPKSKLPQLPKHPKLPKLPKLPQLPLLQKQSELLNNAPHSVVSFVMVLPTTLDKSGPLPKGRANPTPTKLRQMGELPETLKQNRNLDNLARLPRLVPKRPSANARYAPCQCLPKPSKVTFVMDV